MNKKKKQIRVKDALYLGKYLDPVIWDDLNLTLYNVNTQLEKLILMIRGPD